VLVCTDRVIDGGGGDGGVGGGGLFIFVRKQLCNVLNKKFDSCINLRIVEIIFLLNFFFTSVNKKKTLFFTNLAKI
jgi:hypothetical protein